MYCNKLNTHLIPLLSAIHLLEVGVSPNSSCTIGYVQKEKEPGNMKFAYHISFLSCNCLIPSKKQHPLNDELNRQMDIKVKILQGFYCRHHKNTI